MSERIEKNFESRRTTAQDQNIRKQKSGSLEAKWEEIRGDLRLMHSLVVILNLNSFYIFQQNVKKLL